MEKSGMTTWFVDVDGEEEGQKQAQEQNRLKRQKPRQPPITLPGISRSQPQIILNKFVPIGK